MPQWSGSDRRERLPDNWSAIRRRVLRRDGYQCTARDLTTGVRCAEPATDVDHIVPGDDHRETNLRSLCGWHHRRKSSSEGGAARAARRRGFEKKFQRTEGHPGLL
jgi:5-methylcytosine-specific restriction protein A